MRRGTVSDLPETEEQRKLNYPKRKRSQPGPKLAHQKCRPRRRTTPLRLLQLPQPPRSTRPSPQQMRRQWQHPSQSPNLLLPATRRNGPHPQKTTPASASRHHRLRPPTDVPLVPANFVCSWVPAQSPASKTTNRKSRPPFEPNGKLVSKLLRHFSLSARLSKHGRPSWLIGSNMQRKTSPTSTPQHWLWSLSAERKKLSSYSLASPMPAVLQSSLPGRWKAR